MIDTNHQQGNTGKHILETSSGVPPFALNVADASLLFACCECHADDECRLLCPVLVQIQFSMASGRGIHDLPFRSRRASTYYWGTLEIQSPPSAKYSSTNTTSLSTDGGNMQGDFADTTQDLVRTMTRDLGIFMVLISSGD